MQTRKLMFAMALFLCTVLYGIPTVEDTQRVSTRIELVQNGGCEMPLAGGEIPEWVEVVGTNWGQRDSDPSPYEGTVYFFAGAGATAELMQDVDLGDYASEIDAGAKEFSFSARVRSWPQSPADVSQVILHYLNGDKSEVLAAYDLGQHNNTAEWVYVSQIATAPIGARYMRIRLISIRHAGTNNDGYFDAVSFTTDIPAIMAPADVNIQILGNDVALSWTPVTNDSSGSPIVIDEYRVYAADVPDFICSAANLVGSSTSASIILNGHSANPRKFYKVIAVVLD